tara:strand:+ start:278 stop:541 length:264 start_codon:yes stop_codon:yes gene_type:complete
MSEKITDIKKLEPNVTYNIIPNRISKLYWQAQREVLLLHPKMSYADFCKETWNLWEQLAKEKGMDIYDNKYRNEPTEWVPIKEGEID